MCAARTSALALLCACAHAARPPPPPPQVWPQPPAAPVARLAAPFPDPLREPAPAPLWKRVLEAIVGAEPDAGAADALQRPFGVAATAGGFVVVDPDGRRVLRVEGGEAAPLECAGRPWRMPMAAAAAPDGSIWIADGALVHLPDCAVVGEGALERPSGVVVAGGRIYAVDPPRHAVVAFSPDGREALRFGARGENDGELNFPTAIAAGGDGTLLVVDALNFRIARYALDGRWLGSFGEPGDGNGALGRPKGVAAAEGRIFVSDAQNDVVLVFSEAGAFELALGGPGTLTLPAGVAVRGGRLYVADPWNHRVQTFDLLVRDAPHP